MNHKLKYYWISEKENVKDTYIAFRGSFSLEKETDVEFLILGAHWFQISLDGNFLTEGPARFPITNPEFEIIKRKLPAGKHVLSATVHNHGLKTRTLDGEKIPPFFSCNVALTNNDTKKVAEDPKLSGRSSDPPNVNSINNCEITGGTLSPASFSQRDVHISWKCTKLEGYIPSGERISELFSWIEWVNTSKNPLNWKEIDFDDSLWKSPVEVFPELGIPKPLELAEILHPVHKLSHIAEGCLSGHFEKKEIPDWPEKDSLSWYHRNLHENKDMEGRCPQRPNSQILQPSENKDVDDNVPPENSVDGIWRRYDFGRIRLGREIFTIDLPEGSVVEFGYGEYLTDGKVVPFGLIDPVDIRRNITHFIARGGKQTFSPITPKGGRFLEVHIKADPAEIKFIEESFIERVYYRNPIGSFSCNDNLINKIWHAGIRTLSTCSEDAITDNPSRERGQWLGDQLPSIAVATTGYSDLRPFKRSLRQATYEVFEDGMVPGVYPGFVDRLQSFSLLWVIACYNYYKLTGDKLFLEELFHAAEKNLETFENNLLQDKVKLELGWIFIDWGCSQDTNEAGLALRIFYYSALRNMCEWCDALGKSPEKYLKELKIIEKIIENKIRNIYNRANKVAGDGDPPEKNPELNLEGRCPQRPNSREIEKTNNWESLGYHFVALALSNDLIPSENKSSAIEFIKKYILNCFPNNPDALKLANPGVLGNQFITPYFSYFAFPGLIKNDEMDFVLEQYRKCWGWILNQGLTTMAEVFDLNWSHAHVWSASPTAYLSRYVLGLKPCYEKGNRHFKFELHTGDLKNAKGSIPLPFEDKVIDIQWKKTENGIEYQLNTPVPIWLHVEDKIEVVEGLKKLKM